MILELSDQRLLIKSERILEIEKDRSLYKDNEKKEQTIYKLVVLTMDSQRILNYDKETDRDRDYEKIRQTLEIDQKIIKALNDLQTVLNELGDKQ